MTVANDARSKVSAYVETCGEYTGDFEQDKLAQDWAKKEESARGVVQDFRRRVGDIEDKKILDVGFGNGTYVTAFASSGARVSGVEVNEKLLEMANLSLEEKGVQAALEVYDGLHLPYPSDHFDYAYSLSVLEHMSEPKKVLAEVSRVLKSGGCMYLAFPNRLMPRETHTGVWFLSYLPRGFAAFVLRSVFSRNSIEELNLHFIGYPKFLSLLKGTGLYVRMETQGTSGPRSVFKKVLAICGVHFSACLPHIMVILEKRRAGSSA